MVGFGNEDPGLQTLMTSTGSRLSNKPHVIIVVKVQVTTDLAPKLRITDSNISASSFCAQCTNGFVFQIFYVAEVAINTKPIYPNI
jgi:hypothetical protein